MSSSSSSPKGDQAAKMLENLNSEYEHLLSQKSDLSEKCQEYEKKVREAKSNLYSTSATQNVCASELEKMQRQLVSEQEELGKLDEEASLNYEKNPHEHALTIEKLKTKTEQHQVLMVEVREKANQLETHNIELETLQCTIDRFMKQSQSMKYEIEEVEARLEYIASEMKKLSEC